MGKKQVKDEKEQLKEFGLKQGIYDDIILVPQTTKREQNFDEITCALKDGKFYVLREGYSRNSVYVLLRKLKEKANIESCFGVTKTVTNEGTVKQFVIFLKKE